MLSAPVGPNMASLGVGSHAVKQPTEAIILPGVPCTSERSEWVEPEPPWPLDLSRGIRRLPRIVDREEGTD